MSFCRCGCGGQTTVIAKTDTLRGYVRGESRRFLPGHQARESFWRDGRCKHPLYLVYRNMMSRCYNPRDIPHESYAGRGITVCERWRESFWNFVADMGDKPLGRVCLDRIDNDGNYEPGNCRWANYLTSNRNRRPGRLWKQRGRDATGRFA